MAIQHINRIAFPDKWCLILEDDMDYQRKFIEEVQEVFGPQGKMLCVCAPSALWAIKLFSESTSLLEKTSDDMGMQFPTFIILDHDMPYGNAQDFLEFYRLNNLKIPVLTASGIAQNNDVMMQKGATYRYMKSDHAARQEFYKKFL